MKWLARTLSLTFLMTGCAFVPFVLAIALNDRVICMYWHGDDGWLGLVLPIGGALGLAFGLRYSAHKWVHVVSAVLGLLTLAFFAMLFVGTRDQPSGLAAGIAYLIAAALGRVVLAVAAISFVVAGTIRAALDYRGRGQPMSHGN